VSNWQPPAELPDLRGKIKQMAIDTEGRDNGLTNDRGSGWPTRDGHISGLSAAWREGGEFRRLYAPVKHPETQCFDQPRVAEWLKDHMAAGIRVIGHHMAHDLGWLRTDWGIDCSNALIGDTEAMAGVVDENRLNYGLDHLCKWRGIPGKDETLLNEAASALAVDPKSGIWRMPGKYVGPYAEQDAVATLQLAESLTDDIDKQGLGEALQLEYDLMPMVLEMRLRGIRVDVDAAERAKVRLLRERDMVLRRLARKLGWAEVTIEQCRSPESKQRMFAQEEVPNPNLTETGKMSFQAPWMRKHKHWLPRFMSRATQLTDAADKFVDGFILGYVTGAGRIHASINQFRGEEGGTRSYRFSYADPPLQQAPHRDERMAAIFRGAFYPEDGELWASCDYSQQEYRLIVHYAALLCLAKAAEAAQRYRDDPNTDFHLLVAQWTGLPRKPAKDTNFAKAYGAGIPRFAEMIDKSEEEALAIMNQYDKELPFVSGLNRQCMDLANDRGFIKLLDGARSHFDMWERAYYAKGVGYEPAQPSLEAAQAKWPGVRVRRAHTHKAMNRLIQGSAARQTKLWMRACWRERFLPLLQLHDELCFSVTQVQQVRRICELGRDVVELKVPMKVDAEIGPSWGAANRDPEAEASWG
jgi:DNA polymerase I-like protein with 3'-5' exonuclease and polymerase domains